MKTNWYVLFYFLVLPFVVGAAFEFAGPWVSWPTLTICLPIWLGSVLMIGGKK